MSSRSFRTETVAFKVEPELAELLNRLPNKSEFIRRAIAAQLGECCPLCNGKGMVSHGLHKHFTPIITKLKTIACQGCNTLLALPEININEEPSARISQFLDGGPFYCSACYEDSLQCDDCGWQLNRINYFDHVRTMHGASSTSL